MGAPYHKGRNKSILFAKAKVRQKLHPKAQNSNVMSTFDSQKANTKQNNDRRIGPDVIIRGKNHLCNLACGSVVIQIVLPCGRM